MKKLLLLIQIFILISLVSACTTQTQQQKKIVTNELADEVFCTRVKKVGSHMKIKQCMTQAERDRKTKESQDRLKQEFDNQVLRTLDPRAGSGP